jgi:hypothetical protein
MVKQKKEKQLQKLRVANPDDSSLILTETNLYLESKDFEKIQSFNFSSVGKNLNDADLVLILVLSAEMQKMLLMLKSTI